MDEGRAPIVAIAAAAERRHLARLRKVTGAAVAMAGK
jgi:hypothetical protein